MNYHTKIALLFIAIASHTTLCMEQPTELEIIDCNGRQFKLPVSAAQQIMPAIYAAKGSWTDSQKIDLSDIVSEDTKPLLTQENIKALETVLIFNTNNLTLTSLKDCQHLVTIATYLNSSNILFKRLGYIARKQYDYDALPPILLQPNHTYSIKELMEEPFFKDLLDNENQIDPLEYEIAPIQKNRRLCMFLKEAFVGEEVAKPFDCTFKLDLSNYNIGSLDGISDLIPLVTAILKDKQPVHKEFYISAISLKNNSLHTLNLDYIQQNLGYLDKVIANRNPISQIVSIDRPTGQVYFSLALKKTLLKQLPTIEEPLWGTIVRLHKAPLSDRAQYISRKNTYRKLFLRMALPVISSCLSVKALNMLLNKYSSSDYKTTFAGYSLLGAFSLMYGLMSIPNSKNLLHITHKKTIPFSKKIVEFGQDCFYTSCDLITWPFLGAYKMYKSYKAQEEAF